MALKPGDVVSLTLNLPLQLGRFQYLKTSVTLTRTVGNSPESDVTELRQELQRLYFKQLQDDLGMTSELTKIVERGSIEELAAYALRHAQTDAQAESRPKRRVVT